MVEANEKEGINWRTVKIPDEQYKKLENLVPTPLFRLNGITSVQGAVVRIVANFLKNVDKETAAFDKASRDAFEA